jgi:aminocarboxymuconate-semialdehyde decarboxylase
MRKIDIFNHLHPQAYFARMLEVGGKAKDMGKRTRGLSQLRDLDTRFRVMDTLGEGYCQVLTIPGPQAAILASPEQSPELARIGNDGLAELVARYPERFVAFAATLPLNNIDATLRETERAIEQLGARGIEIFTNIDGKPLDLPEYRPLWELMAGYDLPIWMHPSRSSRLTDYASEERSRYEIWFVFGYPYETGAAMARLVFSGIFDRHPGLKIITHHMGGLVPYFEGRVGPGWEVLGSRTSDEDYSGVLAALERPHAEYFKMFYADTALFGARAGTVCGLDYFGVEHVLFASDTPFEPTPGQYIHATIEIIDGLDISDAQRAQIYHGNAERLLRLPADRPT